MRYDEDETKDVDRMDYTPLWQDLSFGWCFYEEELDAYPDYMQPKWFDPEYEEGEYEAFFS